MSLIYTEEVSFWEFVKKNRRAFIGIDINEEFEIITIIAPSDPEELSEIIDIAYKSRITIFNKMFDNIERNISILKLKAQVSRLLSDKIIERGHITKEEAENFIDQARKMYAYASGSNIEEAEELFKKKEDSNKKQKS